MRAVPAATDPRLVQLSNALLLEQEVREKRRLPDLAACLVNETARVHGHDMAILLVGEGGRFRFTAASGVSRVERNGPFARWIEDLADRRHAAGAEAAVAALDRSSLGVPEADWAAWVADHWLWLPLPHPGGGLAGVLVLLRRTAWAERDRLLAEPLAGCYGHALASLPRGLALHLGRLPRRAWAGGALGLALLGFVPVPLTTLAPAEVVASDPVPVTAPFNGVVAELAVRSYAEVKAGDLLLRFDADELTMQRDVAARALDIAEAELATLRNQAYLDPSSKAKLSIQEKRVDLARDALSHAETRLARHRVTAPRDGVVLFDDRFSWKGRPVATGQRLMTLAAPERKELRIDLPPAAMVPLAEGARVKLFLDMDPSHPHEASLVRLGHEALPMPGGGLAYRFVARFGDPAGSLPLGARGTARLHGETVSLGYYLFRRPFAALRQTLGL